MRKLSRITLLVMAHPDDPEMSCGGSVAKWVKEGEVYYVIVSDGGKGSWNKDEKPYSVSNKREEEQERSAKYLGVKRVIFLQHPDGELENIPTLKIEIAALIRKIKPYRIVTNDPWARFFHPDHRIVGLAVISGIMIARDWHFYPFLREIGLNPFRPEKLLLTPTDTPNLIMDITETIEKKIKALRFHKSQIENHPKWENNIRKWAREIAKNSDFEYGEAFYEMDL